MWKTNRFQKAFEYNLYSIIIYQFYRYFEENPWNENGVHMKTTS